MNKLKKIIALTAVMALCGSQVQGQGYSPQYYDAPAPAGVVYEDSPAYDDSERASYLSAGLPLLALGIAAVIIFTTSHHHHHHTTGTGTTTTGTHTHVHGF